ncbi:hypothetical protein [Lacticaseibacillus daqingensis]|uniref:hypothetical protein n=1 Tax=Lacticaseibacillus daqingensis TaxID=2486014 RepID=UPI000F7AF3EE|nr:hypothetical protein [Lacticaseibacillus daqingensis]
MKDLREIDNLLGVIFDSSSLGTVAGIFVAVLLPTVILLLETVQSDSWDRAVLINKVINLRQVFISVCLMAVPTLLWSVPYLKLLLLICYLSGLGTMTRLLWISIRWLMDWTESSQNGIKYRLRRQMLTDNKTDSRERIRVWQRFLASMSLPADKQVKGFSDGALFYEVFLKNYFDMPSYREEILQITTRYLETVFCMPRSNEQEFVNFAFTEFFRCVDSESEAALYFYWMAILDSEFIHAQEDERRVSFLFHAIRKQTPRIIDSKSEFKLELLSSRLFNLLLKRNRGILDDHWLQQTPWKIDSRQVLEKNVAGRAQSHLLKQFWEYVTKIDESDSSGSELRNNGMRLDNLIEVIFRHANPIVIRQIYSLFRIQNFRELDQDWSQAILDSINRAPIFGYFSSSPAIWSDSYSISSEEFFRREEEDTRAESIRISILSLRSLRASDTGWVIRKVRDSLSTLSIKFNSITNNSIITAKSIQGYVRLLQMVTYEVYKERQYG